MCNSIHQCVSCPYTLQSCLAPQVPKTLYIAPAYLYLISPAQDLLLSLPWQVQWEGKEINSKVRELVKMSKSLYLRLLQQIVYFSLMILAILMRRIVERFLGFKIGQIHADKNMVEQGRDGWVSFLAWCSSKGKFGKTLNFMFERLKLVIIRKSYCTIS